jgi:SurA N-terminal domain
MSSRVDARPRRSAHLRWVAFPIILRLLVLCASLLTLASACFAEDEGEDDPVVSVGERTITERDVEGALEHFREEAKREGKSFPDEESPEFEGTRKQVVGLLVYRAQIEEGARRLGVRVPDAAVERRAERAREGEGEGGEEESDEEGRDYVRDTIRAQLAYVAAYRRVTARVVVGDPEIARFYERNRSRFGGRPLSEVRETLAAELLQVKRSRAMDRWVKRTRRVLRPRYHGTE